MEAGKHDLSKKIGLTYAIQLLKEKRLQMLHSETLKESRKPLSFPYKRQGRNSVSFYSLEKKGVAFCLLIKICSRQEGPMHHFQLRITSVTAVLYLGSSRVMLYI